VSSRQHRLLLARDPGLSGGLYREDIDEARMIKKSQGLSQGRLTGLRACQGALASAEPGHLVKGVPGLLVLPPAG